MEHTFYLNFIFPSIIGLISLCFAYIGMRGILTKKPFLISYRWLFFAIILCFFPQLFTPFIFEKKFDLFMLIGPLIFFVLIGYYFMIMQGYVAVGITDLSIRAALHDVLKKMNLDFEEILTGIKLPSISAELQVTIESRIGVGQIRTKHRKDKKLLEEVAAGINDYFNRTDTKINLTTCYLYTFMAICMVVMIFSLHSIDKEYKTPKDGVKKYYYKTGELKYEYLYANGKQNGITKEYYPSGNIKAEWLYKDDEVDGLSKGYFDTGELQYEYNYINGVEDGATKEFYKDGRVRAEWIYKNGELQE